MCSLSAKTFRVGVNIGGTFTDIVCLSNNGEILTNKILSTPDDFTKAIVKGIEEVFQRTNLSGNDITEVVHGCTIATNTILQRSAPPSYGLRPPAKNRDCNNLSPKLTIPPSLTSGSVFRLPSRTPAA